MNAAELIKAAFREGNLIPIGREPTTDEIAEALPRLNNFVNSLYGELAGEEPRDWPVPPFIAGERTPAYNNSPFSPAVAGGQPVSSNWLDVDPAYPPPNSRLVVRITDPFTVYLPPMPQDGALMSLADIQSTGELTINANGRLIDDTAQISIDPVAEYNGRTWFYNAERATWVSLGTMSLDTQSPFPVVFDDMLIIGLFIRLAPRYGKEPNAATLEVYRTLVGKFKRRYRQSQPNLPPDRAPRNSEQEGSGFYLPQGF